MHIHLTDRSLIRLSGVDTRTLLQGIITNDVRLLESQTAVFSALLSPQGKFLHDFFLVRDGDDILLETETRQVEGLMKLLTMYRLRAKVTFTLLPDWHIYADRDFSASPQDNNIHISFSDPRHPDMGMRLYSTTVVSEPADSLNAYETHRLHIGIPEGWKDAIYNRSFLLEMVYDKLHAVDFTKGCYVGQEVTARSRFRAELRKSIHRVTGTPPLPPFGTEILNEQGMVAGEMRSSCGAEGLAMIRHEALLSQGNFTAAGTTVGLSPLAWMSDPAH